MALLVLMYKNKVLVNSGKILLTNKHSKLFNSKNLELDYSGYILDLVAKAKSRLLFQFQNSPVLIQLIEALVSPIQTLYDELFKSLEARSLAYAVQAQLDVLGRLVGQERILLNQSLYGFFGPDIETIQIKPVDNGIAYVTGADLTGDSPANDSQFRQLIIAKIFKNHIKFCSFPELKYYTKLLYNIDIGIETIPGNPRDYNLILPSGTPLYVAETLLSIRSDENTENDYFIPCPATSRFLGITYIQKNAPFQTDAFAGRVNTGFAAINYKL